MYHLHQMLSPDDTKGSRAES